MTKSTKTEIKTTEGKAYSRARDAKAKALAEGLKEGEFEVVQTITSDKESDPGKFSWHRLPKLAQRVKAAEAPIPMVTKSQMEQPGAVDRPPVTQPTKKTITIDLETPEQYAARKAKEAEEAAALAPVTPPPATSAAPKARKTSTKTVMPKWAQGKFRSEIESPTKTVWHIADELIERKPEISRKAIVQECVKRGIAYYTARTQVQLWRAARIESMANQAKVNGGKK